MCKQMDQIRNDLARFNATGELPPAWTPEVDEEFDAQVDEINRALDAEAEAIESGSVEPPRFGWLEQIAPTTVAELRAHADREQGKR